MLIGYILLKTGYLKVKFIKRGQTVFVWKGCEYQIDRRLIREKKFFGVKSFFWLMFDQDNPIPLDFDKGQVVRASQDIPINELAYFANLLRGKLLLLIAIGAVFGAVLAGLALYYGYQNYLTSQKILQYVYYIGSLVKPVVPVMPIP